MRAAQYSQPIREVQMVCNYPQRIINLQCQVTDLQMKQFQLPQGDHTELEQQIQVLTNEQDEARCRAATPGAHEELQPEVADMTQNAQQSGEEVRGFRTQLTNALTLAARVSPKAPEHKGQKGPDSRDFSGLYQTQFRGWIVQLQMIIRHQPASFPDEQSNMWYTFNRLWGIALGQILRHVREDRTVGLEDLPAFIQCLEAGLGTPMEWLLPNRKCGGLCKRTASILSFKLSFK